MQQMIDVKTAELEGSALDWAVAISEGHDPLMIPIQRNKYVVGVTVVDGNGVGGFVCQYSTNWSACGPLIDTRMIDITQCTGRAKTHKARAVMDSSFLDKMGLRQRVSSSGPTALIAACRAIVAAKLGDVVSVPAELVS